MKKLIPILLLLFAVSAFAAESITWEITELKTPLGKRFTEITSTVTTAANGSVTSTILGGTAGGAGTKYDMKGRYLFEVCVADNGTNPTPDSDLYVRHHTATGKDLLGLAGENTIDPSASIDNNCFKPYINSLPSPAPVYGPVYQVVSGNSADSAQFIIKYFFVE